ncbi:MAG: hypothetical protein KF778_12405 [Rhodocyclaceae bacterium]|nr:hypothetical protein [Rhodocyclaceae bacterium]MBX3669198.1 hypothetical protein [Rhodocyclaceae bacterium]
MSEAQDDTCSTPAGEFPFDTKSSYERGIIATLARAFAAVRIFDPDLQTTGLESRGGAQAVDEFLRRPGASLRVVLQHCDRLEAHSPRLMNLLRIHAHCFTIRRAPADLRHLKDCFILADAQHGILRIHADHMRGKEFVDLPERVEPLVQRFDELWELSEPSVAGTTLGL